jgi:hypothetical protein
MAADPAAVASAFEPEPEAIEMIQPQPAAAHERFLFGPRRVSLAEGTAAGVNFGDISQAYGAFLGGPQPPYV